jgi:5-methylcytosine-specific restriction endonuclease McrA
MFACEEIPQAANDNKAAPKRIRAYYDRNKNAPERECIGCGVNFRRRTDSKNAAKFCSRDCAFASGGSGRPRLVSTENKKIAAAHRVTYSVARCICVDCSNRFTSNNLSARRCDDCLKTNRQRYFDGHWGIVRSLLKCPECSTSFVQPYGRRQAIYCSNECSSKKNKRVGRSKRRARERHADNDNIDPFVVFDRDSWRCQLCKIKTPRKLRGTYAPNAPELDHIIPLAAGGSHTYINTQCACRSCNALKSDTPLGQLRLFG